MKKPIRFEKSLTELEDIVQQLEAGDLSLEEALKRYEQGIALVRQCQVTLEQAEQRIQALQTQIEPDANATGEAP